MLRLYVKLLWNIPSPLGQSDHHQHLCLQWQLSFDLMFYTHSEKDKIYIYDMIRTKYNWQNA